MNKREAAAIRHAMDLIPTGVAPEAYLHLRDIIEPQKRKPIPRVRKGPARRGPMRDPAYGRWCAKQPCAVTGSRPGSLVWLGKFGNVIAIIDPAHTQGNGMSSKGPDWSCVPLIRQLHNELDHELGTVAAFNEKYKVDMKALAAEHFARYEREKSNGSR